MCVDCIDGCNMCDGMNQCSQCQPGLFLMQTPDGNISCVNSCPIGFTGVESQNGMQC